MKSGLKLFCPVGVLNFGINLTLSLKANITVAFCFYILIVRNENRFKNILFCWRFEFWH